MIIIKETEFWVDFVFNTEYDRNFTTTKDIAAYLRNTLNLKTDVDVISTSGGLEVALPPEYETLFRIRYAEYML